MLPITGAIPEAAVKSIREAASDRSTVKGLTHGFYRYPARFSPKFVASAINTFSTPGQVVLDPYMGGGTTIVEAYSKGRIAIGCDLNSLAVFVTRAKVTQLNDSEQKEVKYWATKVVPTLSYHTVTDEVADLICSYRTKNLDLPRARPAKKFIALAILSISDLSSNKAKDFARAILLNAAQWALNNRKAAPSLDRIRGRIVMLCDDMISSLKELNMLVEQNNVCPTDPVIIHGTAVDLPEQKPFVDGLKANLIVTSPPYPGIHILYHRWQVDGRKETPAPYWIANCYDGKGASFYNFADRNVMHEDDYFSESLRTLCSIRKVMKDGSIMVQMIAFSNPRRQLPKYLDNMQKAGFVEIHETQSGDTKRKFRRIWRSVPSRVWYANLKGNTNSSREIVLLHLAN